MNDLVKKISSYNLFNYLLPGVLFAFIASKITHYDFIQENIIVGAFFYYFVGMVLSRIGSLVVEPILRKSRFVRLSPYRDYVRAEKLDSKLETLSETNNTYRSLLAMLLAVCAIFSYEALEGCFSGLSSFRVPVILLALLALFLMSYRKQTEYISKRVEVINESKNDTE